MLLLPEVSKLLYHWRDIQLNRIILTKVIYAFEWSYWPMLLKMLYSVLKIVPLENAE